jgi:hypothetical protein
MKVGIEAWCWVSTCKEYMTEIFWDLGLMQYQAEFVLLNMTSRMNFLLFTHKTSNDYIGKSQQPKSNIFYLFNWL